MNPERRPLSGPWAQPPINRQDREHRQARSRSSARTCSVPCGSQGAAGLASLVVFGFFQQGVQLACGEVGFQLAIPGGGIELRKPAPENCQFGGIQGCNGLLQSFEFGHDLSPSNAR